MKRYGFEKLGSIILSGLIVGACSPLAPSVSKLSNAAAQKTSTTDGSAPLGNITTNGGFSSHTSTPDALSLQQTKVETATDFTTNWSLVADAKPSMVLEKDTLESLVKDGKASFGSNADKVKGHEQSLIQTKVEIDVEVDTDSATIKKEGIDQVKLSLEWRPVSVSNREAHWVISLVAPQGADSASVLVKQRDALHDHLENVGIRFQAEF